MSDTDQFSDVQIMARTIYGEARNQSELGKEAVAAVIMNRVARGGWWGNTVREVCLAPMQFSCWNRNDVNRPKIIDPTLNDPVFLDCLRIAQKAMAGNIQDPTKDADSYVVKGLNTAWNKNKQPTTVIGAHVFYKTVA